MSLRYKIIITEVGNLSSGQAGNNSRGPDIACNLIIGILNLHLYFRNIIRTFK